MVVWIALVVWLGAGHLGALRREGRRRADAPAPAPERLPGRPRALRGPAAGDGHRPGRCCWSSCWRRGATSRPRASGSRSPLVGPARAARARLATSSCWTPSASASAARSPGSCWRWRCSGRRRPRCSASPRRWSTRCAASVRGTYLLNNLLTYTTFPLLGGIALHALDQQASEQGAYAVAVFGVFLAANVLNFLMIAGHTRMLRGGSLPEMFRTVFIPVLPWEVASAVMTAMAVYGFEVYGAGIIGLFALALGVYQLLLRALLEGQAHSEEIERRTEPARRAPRGHARAAAGDARAARSQRRPPRRRRRPLRARAGPRRRAVRARAGDRPHRRPAARPRQGGAARSHPDRPQRAAPGRAAADRAPPGRRRAPAAARRGDGRGGRGRARPPRAHRRPGLPGRARRRRASR